MVNALNFSSFFSYLVNSNNQLTVCALRARIRRRGSFKREGVRDNYT